MRILVTGGAGFIGSTLSDSLISLGHSVSIIDNLSTGKREYVNPEASFFEIDINSPNLDEVINEIQPEIVFHHAAQVNVQTSLQFPSLDAEINIKGTINLLNSCINNKVKKIVYASSAAVYGVPQYLPIDEEHKLTPLSFYGVSKLTPENYIRIFSDLYNLDYTIFRYANVFGPKQDYIGEGGVVAIFINKILQDHTPIIFGDGTQTRDFIYVQDIVSANVAAIDNGSRGTFNISMNRTINLNELLSEIVTLTGKNIIASYEAARFGDIKDSCLNNEMALIKLEWQPRYSLLDGLSETINYYSGKEQTK